MENLLNLFLLIVVGAYISIVAAATSYNIFGPNNNFSSFPKNFLFGTGSSSYQVPSTVMQFSNLILFFIFFHSKLTYMHVCSLKELTLLMEKVLVIGTSFHMNLVNIPLFCCLISLQYLTNICIFFLFFRQYC